MKIGARIKDSKIRTLLRISRKGFSIDVVLGWHSIVLKLRQSSLCNQAQSGISILKLNTRSLAYCTNHWRRKVNKLDCCIVNVYRNSLQNTSHIKVHFRHWVLDTNANQEYQQHLLSLITGNKCCQSCASWYKHVLLSTASSLNNC
jgi:hypothetical protein